MAALVYLLWYHGEEGPEGLVATLEKAKVCDLASTLNKEDWFPRVGKPDLVSDLSELLEQKGKEVGIYPLMGGWGGLHLQIVELA